MFNYWANLYANLLLLSSKTTNVGFKRPLRYQSLDAKSQQLHLNFLIEIKMVCSISRENLREIDLRILSFKYQINGVTFSLIFRWTRIDCKVGLTVNHFYQCKTSTFTPLCKTMGHLITCKKVSKMTKNPYGQSSIDPILK